VIILGLNAYHGDASACIFINGELIAAIEEERIRRVKHWAGLPVLAVLFCLKEAGFSLLDIDHITVSKDPFSKLPQKIIHALRYNSLLSSVRIRKSAIGNIKNIKSDLAKALGFDVGEIKAKVSFVEHHTCHMASSYFDSPFTNSAIISLDGMGDFTSFKYGVGTKNKIVSLESVSYPHSIGYYYTCFTQFLGFLNYGDEYKVMGLSSFGTPQKELIQKIYDFVRLKNNGLFSLNLKYLNGVGKGDWNHISANGMPTISRLYSDYLIQKFGPARKSDEELTQYHKDLAASVQKVCEDAFFHLCEYVYKKTGEEYLCLSGGVAQNSVLNGKIVAKTPFKKLYVPPSAHDGGTSLGSALYEYHHVQNFPRNFLFCQAYTGNKYTNEEIELFLKSSNLTKYYHHKFEDASLLEFVSNSIIAGCIVGWFQGRSEFGPRALGNRSILADPRNPETKDKINLKIKRREIFRPFAPSILNECVSDYFETNEKVPYMEKVFKIRKEMQYLIPAVSHVNGTGRLQTVERDNNPKFYKLINNFYGKTGVPILLNTSFNENEPIVNTPKEAFDCFDRTEMDILVLENHVVSRQAILEEICN